MKQYLLGILLAVAACLGASQPALAQEKKDIVDRLETALGVSLPSPYRSQFKEFVATNKIISLARPYRTTSSSSRIR